MGEKVFLREIYSMRQPMISFSLGLSFRVWIYFELSASDRNWFSTISALRISLIGWFK